MDHHENCWIQGACSSDQRNFVLQFKLKLGEHKFHTIQMNRDKH
jgi:hypothetical protein